MGLSCALGHVQTFGDLAVGEPLRHQTRDLSLPRSEI
jgi:hypothetical protein